MTRPSLSVPAEDAALIRAIVDRGRDLGVVREPDYPVLDALMDVTACHANGCPLDLPALASADAVHLIHDLDGIRTHLDRETGEIRNCFEPRYSAPRYRRATRA